MTIEEVKARLVGRTIVRVVADTWVEDQRWLVDMGSVVFVLDDGTYIDSLCEPVAIYLPEKS